MSTTIDTLSNSRRIKNAMERLDDLEKAVTMVMSLIDRELGTLVTQVNALSEVINAITDVVGMSAVQAVLSKKAEEKRNAEQKQIDEALAAGKIIKADKVGSNSIISYEEKDANGQVRIPGKFFKNVATLAPDAQALLKDQLEGFEAGIGNGATMKVLEIWDIAPAAPKQEASAAQVEALLQDIKDGKYNVPNTEAAKPEPVEQLKELVTALETASTPAAE
jgi:hypothetical protein